MPLNIYGERLLFRVFLSKMIHASRNQHQRAEITSCLAVVTIQPSRRPLSSALNELRIEGQSKPVSDSMRRLIPVQATALPRPIIPLPPINYYWPCVAKRNYTPVLQRPCLFVLRQVGGGRVEVYFAGSAAGVDTAEGRFISLAAC